jgi:DNA polymerase-3 subunit epsilon
VHDWLGIRLPNRRIEVSTEYYTWRFGRLAHRPADLRLDTILKALDLPSGGRHDAYHDALTAGLIHLKLAALRG